MNHGYTYTWEEGRQLKSITGNGENISFKYNDAGIRTEKNIGGVTTKYYLLGSKVVYEDNGIDKIYYTYDNSGYLASMNLNGVEYYYIRNAQSDIIGLFDKNGTQVVSYTYDSWGKHFPEVRDENGKILSTSGITGSMASTVGVKNPYRYRGYRFDSDTQLYYLNKRYYNSEWGRFLNVDAFAGQLGELLSPNMFIYSMNNPANMKDPDGFRPIYTVGEETDAMKEASLNVMNSVSKKEPPPKGVGYVPPKGKGKTKPVKAPNGQTGWPDADGNVWVPVPEGHPLAHGGYDNIYPPEGAVRKGGGPRGKFSPQGKRIVIGTAEAGGTTILIYGVYRAARMISSLAPPL